jgi:hypothetical protein
MILSFDKRAAAADIRHQSLEVAILGNYYQ